MPECPPVLLLVCDRADLTRRVVERIREARPARLFVAADGARPGTADGPRLAREARAAAQEVDWDCDVHRLLRERNLGCREAVGSAVTWFFDHVEAGIVLEDDCVPHPSFFRYCGELLERYRDDDRVFGVGGNRFRSAAPAGAPSYVFSAYPQIWGWATWRRAWRHYDDTLARWPALRETGWLEGLLDDRAAARFWRAVFDHDAAGKIDTWDFAWTFACFAQEGLTAHPAVNLVTNAGFDDRALHTRNAASPLADVEARSIHFPLRHPPGVARDRDADRFTSERVHAVRLRTSRLRRWLHRLRRARPLYPARRRRASS